MENKFQFMSMWFSNVEISIVTGSDVFHYSFTGSDERNSDSKCWPTLQFFGKAKPLNMILGLKLVSALTRFFHPRKTNLVLMLKDTSIQKVSLIAWIVHSN